MVQVNWRCNVLFRRPVDLLAGIASLDGFRDKYPLGTTPLEAIKTHLFLKYNERLDVFNRGEPSSMVPT